MRSSSSTTSAADAVGCSGVTIMLGARRAVTVSTTMLASKAVSAMACIISLVACELLGLMNRVCAVMLSSSSCFCGLHRQVLGLRDDIHQLREVFHGHAVGFGAEARCGRRRQAYMAAARPNTPVMP